MIKSAVYNRDYYKKAYSHVLIEKKSDFLEYKKIAEYACRGLDKSARILEIGCGLGTLCYRMSDYSENVIGIDVSEYACSEAGVMYRERKIPFVAANAENLPFKDMAFDAVVVSHLFEHLTDSEAAKIQKEIYRVLKAGGCLTVEQPMCGRESIIDIILLTAFSTLKNKQLFYFTRKAIAAAKRQNPGCDFNHLEGVGDPTHKRIYDAKLLTTELSRAGFSEFKFYKRKLFSILFLDKDELFERYVTFYLNAPEPIRRIFLVSIGGRGKAIKR